MKELTEPMWLLTPLNIIGELALPISLTMRLFGNILAGSIITLLVYTLIKNIAPWGYLGLTLTPFLHMYFDIFSGVIRHTSSSPWGPISWDSRYRRKRTETQIKEDNDLWKYSMSFSYRAWHCWVPA